VARVSSPFVHRLRVRYGECDPQGIVFNAHYIAYFDVALTELWRSVLPAGYTGMVAAGVDMVVAEARARFLAPARFDDEIGVGVGVSHLGTTSLVTAMSVTHQEDLLVEGEMRHVFVDARTHAKTEIPSDVREALAALAVDSDAPG
jgi:acyl-CoA thioester hydrolase